MRTERKQRNIFANVVFAIALALIALLLVASQKDAERKAACEKKGGLMVKARGGEACIKADSIISLDGE